MKKLLMPAAALGAVALWAYAVYAQALQERAAQVLQQIAEAAADHAALRGSAGSMPEDNTFCLLCHANFREEELASTHLAQDITCAACHGISHEHMNDETSLTKPDILFGRAEVAGFCLRCHEPHQRPDEVQAFLEEWKGKVRPNGRLILPQAMCTDCHGGHVITAVRAPAAG